VASAAPAAWSASIRTPSSATRCALATTPTCCTTSWWAFPPNTRAVEFDEQWSFVAKKQKNCDPGDPADDFQGDCWDHVAFDPEHRLVVSLLVGQRTEEHTLALVEDFHERTQGRPMELMTSDEFPAYAAAILQVYGVEVTPEPTGRPGRPRQPYLEIPEEVTYATVHKEREGGRVVEVTTRLVYGTEEAVAEALAETGTGQVVNTAHVERFHGTDRHRNARKVRKSYTFSKDWEVHQAVSAFVRFSYNFCWPVRTLRVRGEEGCWEARTPAMAAGLTDHVWSSHEWLTLPGAQKRSRVV
jgi:IS1 family transposase